MRNSIKILCIKIVVVIEIFIATSLFFALLFLNVELLRQECEKVRTFLVALSENGGKQPGREFFAFLDDDDNDGILDDFDPNAFRNYFSVVVDANENVVELINDFPLDFTRSEIRSIVKTIFEETKKNKNSKNGHKDGIVWLWRNMNDDLRLLCILNRRGEVNTLQRLRFESVLIFFMGIAFTFVVSVVISRSLTFPVSEAMRRQREFVANAGHELKTPIAVISANLDVLKSEFPENRWLSYIREENERMEKLVKELLSLARFDDFNEKRLFQKFDFVSAVKNAVFPFEGIAFEQGKLLKIESVAHVDVFGDEQKIKQVAAILVDNALKNSDFGASVSIFVFLDEKNVVLKVRDTGCGIKKDEFDKIFQRFYRSDSSRARKNGGYGLGLSIARAIAELHSGSLSVESKEGEWTEFSFLIPAIKT